jgi:hypothetical protein
MFPLKFWTDCDATGIVTDSRGGSFGGALEPSASLAFATGLSLTRKEGRAQGTIRRPSGRPILTGTVKPQYGRMAYRLPNRSEARKVGREMAGLFRSGDEDLK